jgi:hypothetical protein
MEIWRDTVEDHQKKGGKIQIKPPMCWSKPCRNSSAQFEGIDDWVLILTRLRGSELVKATGLGRDLLERADAMDDETIDLLMQLEADLTQLIAEQREADAKK